MRKVFFYETAVGKIAIAENGQAITHLCLPGDAVPSDADIMETDLLKSAGQQISEYFAGQRQKFDLPLAPAGTEFQCRVWSCLREIPYGEIRSYQDVAARSGNPRACRAVGQANHRNPIAIIIPCHRVIGAGGQLVGYGGGLDMKQKLLELEQRHRS